MEKEMFVRLGPGLDRDPLHDRTSVNASSDGLYDISVDVNMKINWLEPPKNAAENIARDHKQNLLDEKAHKFAQEIRRRLKEHGI